MLTLATADGTVPHMNTLPSAAQVRALLQPYTVGGLVRLGAECGVPWTTIVKIRNGQTADPRLETVRALWPVLNREREAA